MKSGQRLHARCACSSAGAGGPFVLSGTTRKFERSRPFVVTHLLLDLELDFDEKRVRGSATLDFQRRSPTGTELKLDALGFDIAAVELKHDRRFEPAEFEYDGDTLTIGNLGGSDRGQVRVSYSAKPRRGLYFLAPDEKVKDRPRQVWSQCQDEDARHWFPCLDKPHVKMTTELRVAVPSGFQALSNGELKSADKPKAKGKPWVYHFELDKPHPSYLVTLVVGEFDVVEDRPASLGQREVPVTYYVPKGRRADAKRSLNETPRMIELFSRLLGVDYPWQRYSQIVVSDFIFGGMENTTATTLYEHVLVDERGALDISANDLVAHELAHQWFGDYVTCRDWSHAWLNEGFATYLEHVEREHRLGREEYDYGIAADLESYLSEVRGRYQRAIVCRDYEGPIDLFDRHLYEKGSLVLHMLRRELGDELFFSGVRRYLELHAHGIVETNDLMRALEEVSGRSLERFFDEWVYRPGHPELKVKVAWDEGVLSVTAKQKQKGDNVAHFSLPLEVEVIDKEGARTRHRTTINDEQDALVVRLESRPKCVVFDPEFRIIAAITLEVPGDMLRHQLREAPTAYGRWTAAEALARRDEPVSIRALAEAARNTKEAWMVRAEAARALGRIRSDDALAELSGLARTEHPKVRRAVMAALGSFRKPEAAAVLSAVARKDASYLVEAEAARALGRTRQSGALKTLLSLLDRPSWGDVARAGALDGLAALRDEAALEPVLQRTAYGYPTRGRRAAIAALSLLSDARRVREHLERLLVEDKDPHLKIEVIAALERLGDVKARGALRRAMESELDGRVVRRVREALRELGEAGASDRRKLHDELETLRDDLSELRTRLSKMEAARKQPDEPAKSSAPTEKAKAKVKASAPKPAASKAKRGRR